MKTEDLQLLVDVARLGNFAAVAKELGIDPSSVSRTVAELENSLGVRLFQRTTRRVTLTEAGETYIAKIEPLLEEIENASDLVARTNAVSKGTLRMTASVTFGQMRIVPLLAKFRALHPNLKIECIFSDFNLDLVAERIDLAIRLGPRIESDVIAAKIMDVHYRVVASAAYLRHKPTIAKPRDLTQHRVLLFNIRDFRTSWLFRDKRGMITEVPIDGDITISPAGSLRLATLDHLGPALLPSWLVDDDIKSKRLINLFPDHEVTATTFERAAWLVYPSRAYLPHKVRVMLDFLKAEL